MSSILSLKSAQRGALLQIYRGHPDPQARLRAHILLLLDRGRSWDDIAGALFCSTRTIARWKERFRPASASTPPRSKRSFQRAMVRVEQNRAPAMSSQDRPRSSSSRM